jgi:hypothetical protein
MTVVFTVANLDTGVVASAALTPGSLAPQRADDGRWHVDLTSVVRRLAAAAGAVSVREVVQLDRPVELHEAWPVWLPAEWRPDLPDAHRSALEAALLADLFSFPWLVYLGRTTPDPRPDPAQMLGELCHFADLLCLDLVVEARRTLPCDGESGLSWNIRYEVPGGAVPDTSAIGHRELSEALSATTPRSALRGLRRQPPPPRAYWIEPPPPPTAPPDVDVDQVERRVVNGYLRMGADHGVAGPGRAAGAQAIWRHGRWYHTALLATTADMPRYERSYEPPRPPYQGERIRAYACPGCAGGAQSERRSARSAGQGGLCHRCAGAGRLYAGAVLTVTDLERRAVHRNLRPDPDHAVELLAVSQGGWPAVQVGEDFRLASWARTFGVRPADLADVDGSIDDERLTGVVYLTYSNVDSTTQFLVRASRGQPGARLVILAGPPSGPSLAQLVRLAFGLDLAVELTVTDHRRNAADPLLVQGQRWRARLVARTQPVTRVEAPWDCTVEHAVEACMRYLNSALHDAFAAVGQTPAPRQDRPPDLDHLCLPELTGLLGRVSAEHAGRPALARLDREGVRLYLAAQAAVAPPVPLAGGRALRDIATPTGM